VLSATDNTGNSFVGWVIGIRNDHGGPDFQTIHGKRMITGFAEVQKQSSSQTCPMVVHLKPDQRFTSFLNVWLGPNPSPVRQTFALGFAL
jgi:hypothetical protein